MAGQIPRPMCEVILPVKRDIQCRSCGAPASSVAVCEYCGSFNSNTRAPHEFVNMTVEKAKHMIRELQDFIADTKLPIIKPEHRERF